MSESESGGMCSNALDNDHSAMVNENLAIITGCLNEPTLYRFQQDRFHAGLAPG